MIKYSRQREEILNAVMNNCVHPTANDVYEIVKKNDSSISLATVYRNLNMLADRGEILKIGIPNASDRFDSTTCEHYHMVCLNCGKVFDVDYDLADLSEKVKTQIGAKVIKSYLIMYGVCAECSKG